MGSWDIFFHDSDHLELIKDNIKHRTDNKSEVVSVEGILSLFCGQQSYTTLRPLYFTIIIGTRSISLRNKKIDFIVGR